MKTHRLKIFLDPNYTYTYITKDGRIILQVIDPESACDNLVGIMLDMGQMTQDEYDAYFEEKKGPDSKYLEMLDRLVMIPAPLQRDTIEWTVFEYVDFDGTPGDPSVHIERWALLEPPTGHETTLGPADIAEHPELRDYLNQLEAHWNSHGGEGPPADWKPEPSQDEESEEG